jgi:hypothetical protein
MEWLFERTALGFQLFGGFLYWGRMSNPSPRTGKRSFIFKVGRTRIIRPPGGKIRILWKGWRAG